MHPIVDIGANLANKAFRGDLDSVLDRAVAAGVGRIVITGTNVETSRAGLDMARRRPALLASTAGMHPHHASHFDASARETLRALLSEPEVVAVGECGLDYNRNFSPEADQVRCFEEQLALAAELRRPVFLHERDAHAAFVEIVARWRARIERAVVHCFTGTSTELESYLGLDLYIGITGWICDERRGAHLRELVRRIPANRLLIETDAPYLLPRSMPGRPRNGRNEPAFLTHVLAAVAACRNESPADTAASTTRNAARFFGWEELPPP